MTTHYQSTSRGSVEISTMPLSFAKNSLNKLKRTEPERAAEIEALEAHVAKLEAKAIAQNMAPQPREAVIGDNGPPADEPAPEPTPPTGRGGIDIHVASLIEETEQWADGVAIETQGQADSIARLHRMLQQAIALVDNTAAEEKKPHNDAITEIATWQNGYTAKGLKRTPDGSLTRATRATSNLSAAWLKKQDDERRAREKEAADKALAAAQAAVVIREEAKASTDLAAIDNAEGALAEAAALLRTAQSVAKERVQAGGGEGFRAMSLRSNWVARATGEEKCWSQALTHYLTNPEFRKEIKVLVQKWADRDARSEAARALGVPGFQFIDERVAA